MPVRHPFPATVPENGLNLWGIQDSGVVLEFPDDKYLVYWYIIVRRFGFRKVCKPTAGEGSAHLTSGVVKSRSLKNQTVLGRLQGPVEDVRGMDGARWS